jgi:NitT/TauT family transport system permease protein
MSARARRISYQLAPWVVAIGVLALWEGACRLFKVPAFVLPAPSAIAGAFMQYQKAIYINSLWTLGTTAVGFGFAVVVGLVIGLVIGASTLVYRGIYPLLITFNSIPKVALVPVFAIWFGIGTVPAVLTAFAISVFPIIVNVATGLATIDPEMQDLMHSLGANPYEILTKVGAPRSMPYFFASLKVALTLAFTGSVIAETVGSNHGIGFLMLSASSRFQVPLVFAGIAAIAAMALCMYSACALIERHVAHWAFRSKAGP